MRELNDQEPDSSENMQRSYFDHPATDALERYVLRRCSENELDIVETHIFACESCVCALETLELEIASTKLALQSFAARTPQETLQSKSQKTAFWKNWFSVPTLSWTGAGLAACAFCLIAFVPAHVDLNANRDNATVVVPEFRPAHLILRDGGLTAGAMRAEVVTQAGSPVWSGSSRSTQGQVELDLPRINHPGIYYARLYSSGPEHDLLSEFRFEVKFEL
jgi:hypothetical protein